MSGKKSPFKGLGELIAGGVNIYQGIAGSKARKAEQQEANLELSKRKTDLEATDIVTVAQATEFITERLNG